MIKELTCRLFGHHFESIRHIDFIEIFFLKGTMYCCNRCGGWHLAKTFALYKEIKNDKQLTETNGLETSTSSRNSP